MESPSKTSQELIEEISLLKQRIKELEQSESERTWAEDVLRETVDQTRSLFNNMTEGVALHEMVRDDAGKAVDYRILDVNPAYPQHTGIPPERARNALASELYGADDPPYLSEYEEVVRSGKPFLFETYFPPFKKHFVVSAMRTNPDHFATLFFDITERKQVEDTQSFLLQSNWAGEDFFESLARYLAEALNMDFVCIDRLEGDGLSARTVAVYFDGKFEDNISYALKDTPCGDVVGKTICSFPKGVRHLFPQDGVLQEMNAEGYMGTTLWDSRGQPIGLIALINRKPLTNPDLVETMLRLVSIRAASELERRQAEEDLKQNKALLDATGRMARVGGWEVDAETMDVSWTEETYRIHEVPLDYKPPLEEAIHFFHPDDREKLNGAMQRALEFGEPYDMEIRFITAKGNQLWTRTICHPLSVDGRTLKLLGTFQDITDHKLAEDQIKSLLSEKELLLKEVHHRIKNNMNVIMGMLELQAGRMEDAPAIAALEDSSSRVRSMMALYDVLYQSPDFRALSTKVYFTSLIDTIIGHFPNRGLVTLETYIDDFIIDTKIASPVGIILNELLTNIMKYAFIGRDRGVIRIFLLRKETHATLIVQDNGVGIPESVDVKSSTGFGMQLVGILAKQLDGRIQFERENGTRFILEFEV